MVFQSAVSEARLRAFKRYVISRLFHSGTERIQGPLVLRFTLERRTVVSRQEESLSGFFREERTSPLKIGCQE